MRVYTFEEQLAAFEQATLMDDAFMRVFFKDNIPCVQLMLRIILDKPDIVVDSVEVQYVLTAGEDSRYVRLDVWAHESNGTQIDTEIQNESSGASPQRARYNSAMLDVNILKPKEDYSVLKKRESFVIFITEKDVLGEGEPIYFIDRVIKKSGKPFNDGAHIVYVNASHQDLNTELGRLMHDFHCVRPEDMMNPVFAGKAAEEKGAKKMGILQEMEEYAREEGMAKASENIAINLLRLGQNALEDIAKVCNMTLQQVQELAKTIV